MAFAIFVTLLVINLQNLAAMRVVLGPGSYVALNFNQLRPSPGSYPDVPTLDLRISSAVTFYEAEAPSIQSVEVRCLVSLGRSIFRFPLRS